MGGAWKIQRGRDYVIKGIINLDDLGGSDQLLERRVIRSKTPFPFLLCKSRAGKFQGRIRFEGEEYGEEGGFSIFKEQSMHEVWSRSAREDPEDLKFGAS